MLYAHGSDLCHDAEMRHAMANCFEALMGAIYLDSGINEADQVFSKALFGSDQVSSFSSSSKRYYYSPRNVTLLKTLCHKARGSMLVPKWALRCLWIVPRLLSEAARSSKL